MNSILSLPKNAFKSALRGLGYERKPRPFSQFIAFKQTLQAASAAGMSVGDYIDRKHAAGTKSPTVETIEKMAALGVFDKKLERICEIGPGSGRYLTKAMERGKPDAYEIYETSEEWRGWLVREYGVIARDCDGRSLAQTGAHSVDLVHAHRLFPGVGLLPTLSYFREMARVVRAGGWVVFDIMTEGCFTPQQLKLWFDANPWEWEWAPHMIAKDYTIRMFAEEGINFVDGFDVAHFPAVTECLVFRKQ